MRNLLRHALILCCMLAATASLSGQQLSELKGAPSPGGGRVGLRPSGKAPLQRVPGIGPLASVNFNPFTTSTRTHAPALRVPGSNAVLTGVLVYSDDWNTGDFQEKVASSAGVYNVPLRPDRPWQKLRTASDWFYTRAAVKVNNVYYVISPTFDGENTHYASYSTSTWFSSGGMEIDPANVASDLTYDPTTGKVYGYFYDSDTGDYDRFCEFSLPLGEATEIGLGDPTYAIACNAQGEIYGITYSGRLVRIDKTTGAQEPIGHTGMSPIDRNSMAFDDSTGKLYWAATYGSWYTQSWAGIYEVNIHNAEVTKVIDCPNNESFAGLFIDPVTIPTSAPAAVTDIGVTFDDRGSLTGTLQFTAPTTCIDATALSGNISAIVTIAGHDTIVENIAPGERVSMTGMTFPEGRQTLLITTADDQNRGQSASYEFYAGEDKPGTPVNVVLAERNGLPHLTWEPAPLGLNGGEYDTKGVTYSIVRYPDQSTVANGLTETEFTDKEFVGTDQALFYTVTAHTVMGESDAAQSNTYVFGNGYTVPFMEPFATQEKFDLWTIQDLNGGPSWQYNADGHYAYYDYANTNMAANDWFISPKITLEAGKQYKLTFWAKTRSKSYPENFNVALGDKPAAAAMTTTLADYPSYLNADGENHVVTFSVDNDGIYHLGFHCSSAAQMWQLQITNVGISVMEKEVPAPVDNLTVTAAAMGAMSATVAFNAPATTASGSPLSALSAINVYRNGSDEPVHVFTNPVVGSSLTWEDNGMSEAAVYTYRVVAVNDEGESLSASASAFVGVDAPGAPVNLRLIEQDGKAVLTWQAPTQGRNGGYFDASNLTYQIWRYDNYTKLVDSQTATSFTDESTAAITNQTLIDYVVFPYSGSTRGAYGLSNAVIFGRPYTAPLTETFRSSTEYGMNYYPWVGESDKPMNQGWTLESAGTYPVAADQNGDNGMAVFHSRGESAGIHARFSSPKVSVKALSNPELSFYMYHSHDDAVNTQECIEIEYSLNDEDFGKVQGVKFMRDNGTTGWARHSVPLPAASGSGNLRIAFLGTTDGTPTEGMDIYIDNIGIADGVATDLEATALKAPSRIATGVEATIALTVTNTGTNDIAAYTVTMTDAQGNVLATEQHSAIAASQQQVITLNHVFTAAGDNTISMAVACDGDQKLSNNVLKKNITVVEPVVPQASNLEGSMLGQQVNLQWTGAMNRGAVTDSIETYRDFAIDSIGDWTTIDQDFQMTYYINKDLEEYPDMSSPKAWQVCNAAQLGINIWPEGTPHSGDKMLMAMSAQAGPNNDWLISPELNGSAQVISFFAKAFTDQGGNVERMRVLYSTTGTDPLDFTPLHEEDNITLTGAWGEYVFTVPQGTKHFAIQCVSPGGEASFALFVDDLSFSDLTVPAWNFTGYEIYRNGEKIGETASNVFTDNTLGNLPRATYTVKTIFEQGTSAMSNSWTVTNPADITGDGKIDVEDVNTIINIILHFASRDDYPGADITGDGRVDVEDVNALINIILKVN